MYGFTDKSRKSINAFDKIFIDYDITTEDIISKELKLTEEEVDSLTEEEKADKIEAIEKTIAEETAELSEEKLRKYYYNKYERNYFIKPVNEAKRTALYLKKTFNVDVILNASGSKGVHLRILLEPLEIKHPKEVLNKFGLYLQNQLNLDTFDKSVVSTYNRLERIPTSKHNKTKLYGNFFNTDTKYLEILDNMEVKESMILPVKVDKKANTAGIMDLLLSFDKEAEEEIKSINESFSGEVKYTFNGTEEELVHNFKIMYRQGHRNLIGYKMIHLLRRSGWNKSKVTDFFKNLKVPKCYDKNVKSWINTAYDIKLDNPAESRHLGGLKHFISGIEEEAPADKVETLKNFFINYFSKDKYVIWDKILFNGKEVIFTNKGISFYHKTANSNDYYLLIDPITHNLQFEERSNNNVLEIGLGHKDTKTIFERHKERAKNLAEDLELEEIKTEDKEINKLLNNIIRTIRKNKQLSTIFSKPDAEDNIINIVKANPTDTKSLILLSDKVETEFNIKRNINQNGKGTYYFNDGSYFKIISTELLGTLIKDKYDLKLPTTNVNTVLTSIQRNDNLNKQILQFNNCYLDRDTLEPVEPDDKDIIVKKIGIKDLDTGNFTLLDYDKKARSTGSNTYTEKVLKQILIPKEDNEDTTLYLDRLERFGANVTGRNKFKTITMYFTRRANSGKSVFNLLNSLIFNDNFSIVDVEDLDDKFNYEIIGNKHILVIDETTENSLNNSIPTLKLLRSPNPRKDYRVIYGADKLTINEFGNLEIYTNDKPNIPITEEALFYSIDLLELPNTFLEEKEGKKLSNAYVLDTETYDKLKRDIIGLSWLVSASINAYKKMKKENRQFTCRQSTEETINKFINADDLLKYMALYTELDTDLDNWNSNNNILQGYKNYLDVKGITDNRTDKKLAIQIGYNIKTLFKDTFNKDIHKKRSGNSGYEYSIKIKSISEVEKEFKEVYVINEDLTSMDLEILSNLRGDKKTVYDAIKRGVNTYNKVNSKYTDIDTVKIFRELQNLNLIEKSGNSSIGDY